MSHFHPSVFLKSGRINWFKISAQPPIFRTFTWKYSAHLQGLKIPALLYKNNPFRPNPERREKIKLNLYFHTSLWCLKRFYEGLKGLHKTF